MFDCVLGGDPSQCSRERRRHLAERLERLACLPRPPHKNSDGKTCSRSSARRRGASRARPPRRRRHRARRPPEVLPSPAQGRAEPRLSRMSSNLRQDALNNFQKFQKCHRQFARCGITEKSANSEIRSVQQLESEVEKPRAVQTCAIVDTKNAAQEVFRCI